MNMFTRNKPKNIDDIKKPTLKILDLKKDVPSRLKHLKSFIGNKKTFFKMI